MTSQLTPNTQHMQAICTDKSDITLPVFSTTEKDRLLDVPLEDQEGLVDICKWVKFPHTAQISPWELDVYLKLVDFLPHLYLVPDNVDPANAPFAWARVRCLLASAGFPAHAALANKLNSMYPVCDLTPGEDYKTWCQTLADAHTACGWPVTSARLPWAKLQSNCAETDQSVIPPPHYYRALAALQVFKHLRVNDRTLVTIYAGTATSLKVDESTNCVGQWKSKVQVMRSLGCRTGVRPKYTHNLSAAVSQVLGHITTNTLLAQAPISDLPPAFIGGPWSSLASDPQGNTGFFQTGMRTEALHVYNPAHQAINVAQEGGGMPLAYAFNTVNSNTPDIQTQYRGFLSILPRKLPTGKAQDLIFDAFPNILGRTPAADVLMMLPLYASMMRTEKHFNRDVQMVLCMSADPTVEQSTNHGKTALAHALGMVVAPGIKVTGVVDSHTPVDSREIAHILRTFGTIVMDEWSPPRNPGNIFSHKGLQGLLTGAGAAVGKAHENSGGTVRLRHSIFASCKAVDFPPDMINRSIFWRQRAFTPQEKDASRAPIIQAAMNGSMSMCVRLLILDHIHRTGLFAKYDAMPRILVPGIRSDDHGVLARLLYQEFTGAVEAGELEAACASMYRTHAEGTEEADNSGLLDSLTSSSTLTLRVPTLLAGTTEKDCADLATKCQLRGAETGRKTLGYVTVQELLQLICEVRGRPDIVTLVRHVTTDARAKFTERQIVSAINQDLVSRCPVEGTTYPLAGTDLLLTRAAPIGSYKRIRVEKRP